MEMGKIKSTELRIGNLVYNEVPDKSFQKWKQEIVMVEFYQLDDTYTSFNGIPLTEEWLLKLGFEKDTSYTNIIYFILDDLTWANGLLEIESRYIRDFNHELPHIKYVHQLQNLYFALTGNELCVVSQVQ